MRSRHQRKCTHSACVPQHARPLTPLHPCAACLMRPRMVEKPLRRKRRRKRSSLWQCSSRWRQRGACARCKRPWCGSRLTAGCWRAPMRACACATRWTRPDPLPRLRVLCMMRSIVNILVWAGVCSFPRGVGRGGPMRPRPGGFFPSRGGLPPDYVCNRCGVPGHFIRVRVHDVAWQRLRRVCGVACVCARRAAWYKNISESCHHCHLRRRPGCFGCQTLWRWPRRRRQWPVRWLVAALRPAVAHAMIRAGLGDVGQRLVVPVCVPPRPSPSFLSPPHSLPIPRLTRLPAHVAAPHNRAYVSGVDRTAPPTATPASTAS